MKFQLLPVLEKMHQLYQKPPGKERFEAYLSLLQGETKGDLILPIGGYNPMAKEHVFQKMERLIRMGAEYLVSESLEDINRKNEAGDKLFQVAVNLADDLKGGWTNRFTTDYDSKFKINALVKRRFCTVFLWSSEEYSKELIQQRTREACYRTMYYASQRKPQCLTDFFRQERFTALKSGRKVKLEAEDRDKLEAYLKQHGESDDYHTIFNFFYGDQACESLSFPSKNLGTEATGFDLAGS
ncbi:MAG: hypothetical protein K0R65_2703 [Crocinitomicaceae bacterium]|jgi:hypothetical protein|nr:hypothetical protein [Crocinitomicaceae bacterium]